MARRSTKKQQNPLDYIVPVPPGLQVPFPGSLNIDASYSTERGDGPSATFTLTVPLSYNLDDAIEHAIGKIRDHWRTKG